MEWTGDSTQESANPTKPSSTATAAPISPEATTPTGATTSVDPLARLLADARWSSVGDARQPASAVAGRLAEVETSIARATVERRFGLREPTLRSASVTVERGAPTPGRASDRTAVVLTPETKGEKVAPAPQAAVLAAPAAAPGAGLALATSSVPPGTSFVEGPMLAGTSAGPAADLASDADAPPEAVRLAARGASVLASGRGGSIVMRLEPPALGPLRIEIQIARGAVEADFTASSFEARTLLEANAGILRERLESQGLAVERLSVHGSRAGDGAPPGSQGGDGRDARQGDGERPRQDAAGGESRGRRDGEHGRERGAAHDVARDGDGSFAGFLGPSPRSESRGGAPVFGDASPR